MSRNHETVTTVVGQEDIGALIRVASTNSEYGHTHLTSVSAHLAILIGRKGLDKASDFLEPIAYMDLDREQRHMLREAHQLRESSLGCVLGRE